MTSSRLRWGLLSTALINRKLIPAIRSTATAELVAVASRDLGRAKSYAQEWDIPKAHGSYEEMLADQEIDCIYNPLPNNMHGPWSMRAMRLGKHVLCEKPFSINAAEAVKMAEVALETGKHLMEAFMYRFHPQMQRLEQILGDGEIGEVNLILAGFGFRLVDLSNVRLRADLAGGAVMDLGTYPISFMRFVTKQEPTHAFAVVHHGPKSGVDETMLGTLTFPNGISGQFDCSFRGGYHTFARVMGTDGSVEIAAPFTPKEGQAGLIVRTADGTVRDEIAVRDTDSYQLEVEHFCAAVMAGTKVRWTPNDSILQMRVIDALYRSSGEGRVVPVAEPMLDYVI